MNLLIERPPSSVWIGDVEYEIRSDFRISILFELMMQDPEVDSGQKMLQTLDLYYPVIPSNTEDALAAIVWFYQCGKEPRKTAEIGRGGAEECIYSFEFDDGYIYSAFLEQYGIDLNETQYLHWWKFRALFLALKEGCEFRRIMGFRAMEISSSLSQKEQAFYREMKEQYRIPMARSEQEKLDAIEQALLNGGDLTGLL